MKNWMQYAPGFGGGRWEVRGKFIGRARANSLNLKVWEVWDFEILVLSTWPC